MRDRIIPSYTNFANAKRIAKRREGIMLTGLLLVFSLLQLISAGGTGCAACDSLQSLWNPDTHKGSCIGNPKNPVKFIINFEQCICGTKGQNQYQSCIECNLVPEGGVPIDGLNFGPLSIFQAQCSIFSNDINTILKPKGLIEFVRSIRPQSIAAKDTIDQQDILAIEILTMIKVKDPTATKATGNSIPGQTNNGQAGAKNTSESGSISPIFSLFSIVAVAVVAVIW